MHGLRFSNEVDGDRAEHVGPRLTNVCLPTVQKNSAAHPRKRNYGGVVSAKEVRSVTGLVCNATHYRDTRQTSRA
jgi:hypothetical protein